MSRRPVARKIGFSDVVDLLCPCGKRLATLDFNGFRSLSYSEPSMPEYHLDGIWFVRTDRGQPIHADDWRRIKCPRCGRDWRGWGGRYRGHHRSSESGRDSASHADAVKTAKGLVSGRAL